MGQDKGRGRLGAVRVVVRVLVRRGANVGATRPLRGRPRIVRDEWDLRRHGVDRGFEAWSLLVVHGSRVTASLDQGAA